MNVSKLTIGLFLLALGHVLLRLMIPHPGFMRDELLYLVQARHLSFGYASVPPLTAWIGRISLALFGQTIWAAKVYPALLSGIMVFLVAGISKEMGVGRRGLLLSVSAYSVGVLYFRTFYLFQPVCTDIFLWTVNWYLLLRILNGHAGAWYLLGASVGLGLLNKYLLGLQVVSLLVFIPFTPFRKWFGLRAFWYAAGIAGLIFIPNVLWQIKHHWPLFMHLQTLHDQQLVHVNWSGFLTDQLLMPFAGTLLVLPGALSLLFAPGLKSYRILIWSILLTFVFLLLVNGKSYYTAGLFVPLIVAGGQWWASRLKKEWMVWAMILIMAVITLPVLPIALPVFRPERLAAYYERLESKYGVDVGRRFEDGTTHALPQDFADMLGWDELANVADKAYAMTDPGKTVIYAENYGQAGAVAILGNNLPEPLSFHESYLYWAPRNIPAEVNTLIYINDELGEDVANFFGQVDSVGQITNPLAREFGTRVYVCSKPTAPLQELWQSALDRVGDNPF